jgi:hypothetical protein
MDNCECIERFKLTLPKGLGFGLLNLVGVNLTRHVFALLMRKIAQLYPSAHILGTDLSAIQPTE